MAKLNLIFTLSILFLAILFLPSCQRDGDSVTILRYDALNFTIQPQADTIDTVVLGSGSFIYNLDSFFLANSNNHYGIEYLQNMEQRGARLSLQNTDSSNNVSNISFCSFYIKTNAFPTGYKLNLQADSASGNWIINASPHWNCNFIAVNNSLYKVIEVEYKLLGRLRKPITDTIKCNLRSCQEITCSYIGFIL